MIARIDACDDRDLRRLRCQHMRRDLLPCRVRRLNDGAHLFWRHCAPRTMVDDDFDEVRALVDRLAHRRATLVGTFYDDVFLLDERFVGRTEARELTARRSESTR